MTQELPIPADVVLQDRPLLRSRWIWLGGLLAFGLALLGYLGVGEIYGGRQAIRLLEAVNPSVQTLCFAAITACSTILALMLTMVALAHQSNIHFDEKFFRQVKRISLLCTITLSFSTLLLAFISIPLNESDTFPAVGFRTLYYGVIFATSLLSGLLIAIVMMLYETIGVLIHILTPNS